MATLRRLIGNSRVSQFGQSSPITLVARGFCHRSVKPRLSAVEKSFDGVLVRSYATATKRKAPAKKKTTTTRKTTKRKTATKKKTPAKKAKKPKKKAVKKVAKKRKVAKKPKKPVRPKVQNMPSSRSISSYVVFLQSALKSVTGPDPTSRLRNAVSQWKALSDAEKQTWSSRAEAINATRKQEYQNAVASMTPQEIKTENTKRRLLAKKYKQKHNTHLIKDPNAPKRPVSAFLRYANDTRVPGASVTEGAKEASQRWKALSVSDKQPYLQAHDADKNRYARESAAYFKG